MKQLFRIAAVVVFAAFVFTSTSHAQVPYSEGHVERVVLLELVPGHSNAFWADVKTNVLPIWEAEKKSGLILDYQIFLNTTTEGKWDVGYSIVYANMAALDGLADKIFDLRMNQYGDQTAEQKVIDKRVENAHVVSSMLLRDIKVR
jgi:hypothetical protein